MPHELDREALNQELGGAYQIVRELGRGAFATVYLARERVLHRLVAIKVLRLERAVSEEERERFMREARTAAHLDHPGIVPVLAFGETPTTMYMVMRYIDGESLADRLKRESRLPPEEARRLLLDLASALAHAHRQGVVHRDIKPENVLLTPGEGGESHARLLDFGVAAFRTRDLGMTASREMWGTPTFMSPEQALGEVDLDARSDIYALGVLGYVMLAGRDPFTSTSPLERLKQQQRGPAIPLARAAPRAPAGLVAAIDRCLAYEPQERWRRTSELVGALLALDDLPAIARARAGGWRRHVSRVLAAPGGAARRRGRRAAFFRSPPTPRLILDALRDDVRYAARGLAKAPGFATAVIFTLAIGFGATTVVFSAIEALLLREVPVRDPASLVVLQEQRRGPNDASDFGASAFRYDRYLAYREATAGVLTGLAAQKLESFSVRLGDRARPVFGAITSGNYFEVLGVRPALGRFYTAASDREGAAPEAVIGYAFWRGALGGDPKTVGRTLFLNSRPLAVVGVAPPDFNGALGGVFGFDVWVPAAAYMQAPAASPRGRGEVWTNLFGRLRPGVDSARASAALRVIAARVPTEDPRTRITDAWVEPLTALPLDMKGPVRGFLNMLLAVAGVVLLIAATNTAGMLLARAAARRREVATRLAVGASRGRVVGQLLVESSLLCVAGGVAGLLLTWWLTRLLNAWQPPFPIEVAADFGLNGTVLAVAAATVLGAGLLSGLAPAVQGTGIDLVAAMKEGGPQSGVRRTRLRSTFVVAQVAMSVLLLAVAGLFVRALQRALAVDPGFVAAGVVRADLSLGAHGYDTRRARALLTQLRERLRARPEVAAVSFANAAPLSGNSQSWGASRSDRPDDEEIPVQWGVADVGFIELLRTPLVAGRTFTAADGPNGPFVTVINEATARRLWPELSPREVVGRTVRSLKREMTVVGVMRNGKYRLLHEEQRRYGYVPFTQVPPFGAAPTLYARARTTPAAALRAAREELAELDPNVALEAPVSLEEDLERYVLPQRIGAMLIGAFGAVGLVLAATGLYAVLAYGVAQRLREFGVRMALGARAADLVRLVVRHGLLLVAIGVAVGLGLAVVAGRLVASFLFGLSPADPLTLAAVPLILVAAALLASVVPARRAAAADPMASLRAE
ncbi:MAG: ADOP family duplicated permease [Gemmatimonadaceae bacterium]